jgi:plastocyanin
MKQIAFPKWVLIGAAVLAVVAGALSSRLVARADGHEGEAQTYIVRAGAGGVANGELLGFAPQLLQIHRGDAVTWTIEGFHNIHFASEPASLFVESEVNGQTMPVFNSAIAFPSIDSGSTYSGGDVSSGLSPFTGSNVFSVTVDLEPGTYSYLCDIHAGMVGVLTVVDDDTTIPSPYEVSVQAANEIVATVGASAGTFNELNAMPMMTDADTLDVQAGSDGAVTLNAFFPFTAVISAGQSITWTVPVASFDPHTVSAPSLLGQDFTPVEVEGQPPVLTPGAVFVPVVESGGEVGADAAFNSGLLLPGQSYTLTFTEPGVYPYYCSLHVGMQGTVVVQPGA